MLLRLDMWRMRALNVMILVSLGLLVSIDINAQTIDRDDDGHLVLNYPDGGWRYFSATDSTVMDTELTAYLNSEEVKNVNSLGDTLKPIKKEIPQAKPKSKSKGFQAISLSELEDQWHLLTDQKLTIQQKINNTDKYSEKEIELFTKQLGQTNAQIANVRRKLGLPITESSNDPVQVKGEVNYEKSNYAFKDPLILDALVKSPPPICNANIRTNEHTGEKTISTAPEFLFQHTPQQMKRFLKDQHYLDAYVSLSVKENRYFLSLMVEVNAKNAKVAYGILESNSLLRLSLINGESIPLFNGNVEEGKKIPNKIGFRYITYYPLSKDVVKLLSRYEINQIRIAWSAGYEDYEVYFMDVIKNQLNCIDEQK